MERQNKRRHECSWSSGGEGCRQEGVEEKRSTKQRSKQKWDMLDEEEEEKEEEEQQKQEE